MTLTLAEVAPSTTRQPVDYEPKLFTAADLALFPLELPSGPVRYELDNGRLISMTPPGDIHAAVEMKFAGALLVQGELQGLGKARCGDVGIVLWRNPDRVVGADAAFIATASLPIRRTSEGYLETIPELIVEVRSPNDTLAAMQRKVEDYLAAGVKVVWVADPIQRQVTEHRPGQLASVFGESDTLTVPDIIPGFRLSIREALQD